jgi:hypothetical protein
MSDSEEINEADHYDNHVLRVCSALGGSIDGAYFPGDEAIDCLRDLKRFLRQDEQEQDRITNRLLGVIAY